MLQCDSNQIKYKNQVLPWNAVFPAKQVGSANSASNEIEFQCCTALIRKATHGRAVQSVIGREAALSGLACRRRGKWLINN